MDGNQKQKNDDHYEISDHHRNNKNLPLVSIIIPVYNAENYIEEAIVSALNQTYSNIEIIIINDGSTDETQTILQRFLQNPLITILSHKDRKNLGASYSRKLGIDIAKGKYIAFLDADDLFMPQKISLQVAEMEKNPEVILCHSNVKFISETIKFPYKKYFHLGNREFIYKYSSQSYFIVENHICTPTAMVKGDVIKRIPHMKERIFPTQYEDWFTWILLGEKGPFLYVPQQLIYYRYHTTSTSINIYTDPIQRNIIYLEMLLSLLPYLINEMSRSIVVLQLQNTILKLIDDYSVVHHAEMKMNQISLATLGREIFFGGLSCESIPSRYQYLSLIESFSADEIAKATRIKKIVKVFILRLVLLYRLRFGKFN